MTSSALRAEGCAPSLVVEDSNSDLLARLVIPLPSSNLGEEDVDPTTASSSSLATSSCSSLTRVFVCLLGDLQYDEVTHAHGLLHTTCDVDCAIIISGYRLPVWNSDNNAVASLKTRNSFGSAAKADVLITPCTSAAGSALVVASRVDLLLVYVLCLLLSLYTFVLLVTAFRTPSMGNEGSALSSESSTPLSEYQSMYSLGSRVRSSVESTRAPSPMEPPEPDLSHLTEEEVAKIKEVMNRAKAMQEEEQSRARRLEEEYINFATKIEREASLTELSEEAGITCPICSRNQLPRPARSPMQPRSPLNVCVDCEKPTCQECGALYTSAATRQQEWVCVVCERRRKLMMSTGMWYHGYHPDGELPLERKLINPDTGSPLEGRPGGVASAMTLSSTSKDSQDSRRSDFSSLSAEINLLTMTSSQNSELARQMYEQSKVKGILMYMMGPCGPGAALPKSESDDFSDLASDLDFDEVASERSRPDGSSTEEIARDFCVISHPTSAALQGGSQGYERGQKGDRRQKHRPKSLNLSRSHSHTSSDEDGDEEDSGGAAGGEHSGKHRSGSGREEGSSDSGPSEGAKRKDKKPADRSSWKKDGADFSRSHPPSEPNLHGNSRHPPPLANPHTNAYSYGPPNHPPPVAHHHSHPPYGHAHQLSHVPIRDTNAIMPAEFVEPNKAVNSPTPPRSPSWREGLESPPFSPRRRDSYPGKKSRGSPVSPRDKKMHFTYNDLSPSPRAYSFDDGYEGQLRASVGGDTMSFSQHGVNSFSQRLSPKSPDEEKESFASAMAHQLHFELPPTRGAKTGSSTLSSFGHSGSDGAFAPPLVGQPLSLTGTGSAYVGSDMIGLPHSAPVMDLATFAATVASNTATLTSMTVSPTAILPHGATGMSSQHPEPLSPDSVDSTDSTSSPGSPGYYDNANSTSDDMEDMELADPTSKSIDMGSSKRQKARPPSTDWSPVIDLSPILDVSPSVEEAEQEDMLAKQLEELERQRSREESDMDRDDADMEDDEDEDVHMVSMSASMSSSQDRSESFNPFALRSDHKLEDDSSDGLELTEFTSFSALKRYDKIEDISKIGDNCMDEDELIHVIATETADAAIAAALEEHKRQLLLNEDENGNPPSPSEDLPFPSCTSQAEATATCSTGPTTVTASMSTSVTSGGGFAEGTQEQDARSQRRALEAHISDEISKITQGMQDIVRRGAADVKPIPPPKPRRRLPEPTPEMTAAAAAVAATAASSSSYSMISPIQFAPPPSKSPSMSAHRKRKTNGPTPKVKAEARREEVVLKQAPVGCRPSEDARQNELAEGANQTASAFTSASGTEADDGGIPRQDSAERRKAKDMKAKPSPLLIQHIEAEEQSVSPHYRVMDSPPTPENKLIKREFSESTSVSPSSSPDADHYMYPSPVTPPDSDLSPPKPHSPSSTGTDLDEDTLRYSSAGELSAAGSGSGVSTISAGAQSLSSQANMDANVDLPSREREEGEPCLVKTFANPIVPIRSKAAGGPAADDNPIPAKPPLPVRPKPSPRTTEHTGPETEEGPSVRDKIRAFEKIANIPKEKRIEPRREVRRELPKKAPKPPPKDPAIVYTSTTCTVTTTTPPATSTATKDSKKVRRKLPPIPVGEEPILASKTKLKRPKPPARKTDSSPRLSPPSAPPRTTSPLPRQPPPPPRQQQQQQPLVVAPELEKHLQQRQYDVALSRKPPQQQQQQQHQQPQQFTRQTPQLSPTLQQLPPPMPALHQPLLQRGAEDALNEEDMEVAQITTKVQDKRKVPLGDIMKSKSIESSDPTRSRDRTRAGGLEAPGGYSLQRAASVGSGGSSSSTFGSSSMDETDAIIDALINIYGIPITEAMKSLKRRLQEELRRVTRDRKRKLEELEEIRALQMQIGALRLEGDAYKLSRHGASGSDKRAPSYVNITVESKKALTPRSSPQVTPRRQRHKRQSSDPMISKFSPIKEDKDIEADFQTKLAESYMVRSGGGGGSMHSSRYSADDSSQSGLSDSESTRSEPVGSTRYKKGQTTNYAKMYYPGRSGSSERLHPEHALLSGSGAPLSGSRSEQYLATGYRSGSRTPTYYSDDEEKSREERKAQLQYEIQKRRQQLEETARLKKELLKLARARQAIAHSYDDIPRQYGPPSHADRGSVGNLNMPPRPVPRGIIRPIDDDIRMAELAERERERELERLERAYMERDDIDVIYDVLPARRGHQPPPERDRPVVGERSVGGGGVAMPYQSRSNYSSTEYLVHKQQETARRQRPDEPLYVNTAPGWMYGTDLMGVGVPESQSLSQPVLTKRIDSLPSVAPGVPSRDGKLSSSVTLPDIYSNRCDLDFRPPHPVHASLSSSSHTYVNTSISDTDGSPTSVSDVTPAMPLLDDVKDKSRKIIHNIGSGSRPVSAEFNIGDVEDLMNGMYRVESDNSVDADEPIMKHMMEGGVTILKQMERKRRPPPVEPTRYNFPVKRILVTRDPKDRSVAGNGIGMKIVGGKEISGTSETGAFVTAIYPGLIADQLHGELEVGDQVLEWNGIKLTGKTYEEVQQIITQTNGEIELVVRAQSNSVSEETNVKQVESCHSSYDNLPAYEEVVKDLRATSSSRQGVDPRLLAAQLEEIQEAASPAEQSPSSSQQGPPTPSMSSPCSTPRSDPTSTSSDKQRPSGGRHTPDRRDRDRIDRRGGSSGGSSGGTEKHHRRSTRHHRDSERERERDSERGERDRSERDFNDARDRDRGERERSSSSARDKGTPTARHRERGERDRDRQHRDSVPDRETTPTNNNNNNNNNNARQQERPYALPSDGSEESAQPLSSACTSTASSLAAATAQTSSTSTSTSTTATAIGADMQGNERRRNAAPASPELAPRSRTPSKKNKHAVTKDKANVPVPMRPEDKGLGAIQLQLSHDDYDNTLNVHVIQAVNLRPRDINGLSDPFVKVYLLPGRGPENKRRTKHIPRTLNPEWHQTLVFQDVARGELQNKVLELTVWDYDRFKANDFLGELVLELSEFGFLDNKPHWYPLREHVIIQSFELPKSSVPPPLTSTSDSKMKSKSPRHGKRQGASATRLSETSGSGVDIGPRRRSMETLANPDQNTAVAGPREQLGRQTASATNSPAPRRKPRDPKSPVKARSNGLLYR